ncbi:MAG: Xaa-Pro peptidase family protein [Acidimicrobiia bacterium]|nr:Xaa-Pro peptidase family protein [Acidimicrobiia bacterium]
MNPFADRVDRARSLMIERNLDGLLLSVGADLPYFTGYEAMQTERLTMLVLPADGDPVLFVPELEASRVERHGDLFEIRPWSEREDPVALVSDAISAWRHGLIGDHTWATFVLGLQERLPGLLLGRASETTREQRMRKDTAEIDALRRAGQAADRVVARLRETPFAGRTEREMARMIAEMTVEEGHQVAEFGIVASGPNGASPHHESGERIIEAGDAVVVDFGGRFDRYYSDTTRNFVVGAPPDGYLAVFQAVRAAHRAAVEAVRPGVTAGSIDAAARAVIADAGFSEYFIHRTGHGIGLEVHEHPYIVEGNGLLLEPGMSFSIEPGIYLPGQFGVRLEDIVVVTNDGVDRLNRSELDLAPVG